MLLKSVKQSFVYYNAAKLRRILPHSNKFLVFHSKSIRQLPLFCDCRFLPLKICRTKGSAPFIRCAAFVVLEILPAPLSACDAWLVQVVSKSKTSCFTIEGGIYFTRLDVIFEGKTTCFTFKGATPSSSNRIGFTFSPLNNKQKGDVKKLRSPL